MFNEISAADAARKLPTILYRVSQQKESFLLTRQGEALAAIVPIEGLKDVCTLAPDPPETDRADEPEGGDRPKPDAGETLSWDELCRALNL